MRHNVKPWNLVSTRTFTYALILTVEDKCLLGLALQLLSSYKILGTVIMYAPRNDVLVQRKLYDKISMKIFGTKGELHPCNNHAIGGGFASLVELA